MAEIAVPKLNTNDDSYLLLAWLAPDGQAVAAGTPVAEVETSKAVEELTAATSGVLRHRAATGADITPGQVIALVDDPAVPAAAPIGRPVNAEGPTITAPARARMAELGVTAERVAALGRPIIRRADIDALAGLDTAPATTAATPVPGSTVDERAVSLSRNQRACRAHRDTLGRHDPGRLHRDDDRRRRRARPDREAGTRGAAAGRPGRTVRRRDRVGARRAADVLRRLDDDGTTVHPSGAAHVGVTVDLGEGLYVPVVRDAGTATIAEIARTLTRHRVTAAGGTFRQSDLDGAGITLTLHLDAHVSLAIRSCFRVRRARWRSPPRAPSCTSTTTAGRRPGP